MKKILIAILAVIIVATAFSCADKNNGKTEEKAGYERGYVSENTYVSKWAGVSYTAPEGINVLPEDETYMLMGLSREAIEVEGGPDISQLDTIYEMYGASADGSMVIINTFKNIDTVTKIAEMKVEFDGKVNDLLKPTYGEETAVTYGGVEFTRLDVTASAPDFEMYQTYLLKDVDENVFCISAAALGKEQIEVMLGGISQYK